MYRSPLVLFAYPVGPGPLAGALPGANALHGLSTMVAVRAPGAKSASFRSSRWRSSCMCCSEAPRGTFQSRGREPCDKLARGPTPRSQERKTHRQPLSHLRTLVRVVEPADGAVEWHWGTDVSLCPLFLLHRSALDASLWAFSRCIAIRKFVHLVRVCCHVHEHFQNIPRILSRESKSVFEWVCFIGWRMMLWPGSCLDHQPFS